MTIKRPMTDLEVTLQISQASSKVCLSGRRTLDLLEMRKKDNLTGL